MSKIVLLVVFILISIETCFAFNEVYNEDMAGEAVQILKFVDGKPEYDHDSLSKIFLNDKIKGKPTIIISMVGDQGIGKSYLLNLCLRYLNYMENKNAKFSDDWLETKSEFNGFKWGNKAMQGGTTEGILIWSKPFILNLEHNTEVALFLMDTQGSHDVLTDTINNAVVFSLSTFISSIQIYNINKKPKLYDYKHLAQFTTHGSNILEQGDFSEKSFQQLIFLIRDWSNPTSYAFGVQGGEKYKNEVLFSTKETNELNTYVSQIKDSFSSINCFLMPYPGDNIAEARDFSDIKNSEMNKKFHNEVRNFMNWLFGKHNINYSNTKKVNGIFISPEDIPIYYHAYFTEIIKVNGNFKSIDDFNNANVRVSNQAALTKAYLYYLDGIKIKLEWTSRWFNTEFITLHIEYKLVAIQEFHRLPKLGDSVTHTDYENQLLELIDNYFKHTSETRNAEKYSDFKFIAGATFSAIFNLPSVASLPYLLFYLVREVIENYQQVIKVIGEILNNLKFLT